MFFLCIMCNSRNAFTHIHMMIGEKGRNLIPSFDKSPYTHKKRQRDNTKTPPISKNSHNDCGPNLEPSTRLIFLSMITESYFRFRRRLTIFEPDETKFALHLTLLSLQTRSSQKTQWEIPSKTYSANDISPNLDKSSEYDLKNFPTVFLNLWYL